jgi:hypothetical protein
MNLDPESKRTFVKVQHMHGISLLFIAVGRLTILIEIAEAEENPKTGRRLYDRVKYCVECVIKNWWLISLIKYIFFWM